MADTHHDNFNISFSILRGASMAATVDDVCCGKYSKGFTPVKSNNFMTGFGKTAIWLRLERLPGPGVLDFGPMIDDVTLFRRNATTGEVQASSAGDILPLENREIVSPRIVIPVSQSDSDKQLFVRIVQENNHSIAPVLIERRIFESQKLQANIIHTVLISAISMMIIFNMFLGNLIGRVLFLYNAAIALNMSIANLYFTGVGPAYVWNKWAWASNSILELAVMGACIASAFFFYTFLKSPGENPLFLKAIFIVPVLVALNFLLWLVVPGWVTQILQFFLVVLTLLYCSIIVTIQAIRGSRKAMIMLPGTLFAVFPGVIAFLVFIHFSSEPIAPANHVFEITLFFEALFFSLLLAFQIRRSERDAESAYNQLDRVQKDQNRKILETIDNERRRISADLHDSAGQGLMAITTRLRQFLHKEELTREQRFELNKAADYSRQVVGDIRRISHELHPATIDHLGWRKAIEELFVTLQDTGEVEINLQLDLPEDILDELQKLHLYRVVQEAVSNIARHSGASECSADFHLENNIMKVTINDNGQGQLAKGSAGESLSLGHVITSQRIAQLGGQWAINRRKDKTEVSFSFPLGETQ